MSIEQRGSRSSTARGKVDKGVFIASGLRTVFPGKNIDTHHCDLSLPRCMLLAHLSPGPDRTYQGHRGDRQMTKDWH